MKTDSVANLVPGPRAGISLKTFIALPLFCPRIYSHLILLLELMSSCLSGTSVHGLHRPVCNFNCNRQSGRLNTLSWYLDFKRIKWLQSHAEAIFTELENHYFSAIVSSWPDSGRVSGGATESVSQILIFGNYERCIFIDSTFSGRLLLLSSK